MKIYLNSIDKVKKFVNEMSKIDGELMITSGRYTVDAKSIMGIFSLDLAKEVTLSYSDGVDISLLKERLVEIDILREIKFD